MQLAVLSTDYNFGVRNQPDGDVWYALRYLLACSSEGANSTLSLLRRQA